MVAAGLSPLIEKTLRRETLDSDDTQVLKNLTWPMLGKLVDWLDDYPIPEGEPASFEQPLADWDDICQELFALRSKLPHGQLARWTLRLPCPLDGLTESLSGTTDFAQDPTGAEVLRVLLLARLVLPQEVEVAALAGELGEKMACIAAQFGIVIINVS
jgi:hypothetical protein